MKHNPYDAAIGYLRYDIGDDDPDIISVRAAIRLLEAAGKVDQSALETFMEMVCKPRDVWEEARVKEIRDLLAAIPEEK